MFAKPQKEHEWFQQLVGDWKFEHACTLPDGTESTSSGTMTCRMLGGLWLISESVGGSTPPDLSAKPSSETANPEGGPWTSIMTLGFDPAKNGYVGTFVASMMTHIWQYRGEMDERGDQLFLYADGPAFDGKGNCEYRDTIKIVDADTWVLNSAMKDNQGKWQPFMTGTHLRTAAG